VINSTRVLYKAADTLDGQLEQAGIIGGEHGDAYQKHLAEADKLLVPVDDFGRVPYVAATLKKLGYKLTPPSVCEECQQRLGVNRGRPGKVAAHFQHFGGRRCPGGMSPWHVAMQTAAVNVGFKHEYQCREGMAHGRVLDAFYERTGLCLEFVNSMSQEYQRKHSELLHVAASGGEVRRVAWIFNSGARFATWAHDETVDAAKLYAGTISVGNLFRDYRGVRELIKALGERNSFTIYRGLMLQCIGCDLWECLPEEHPLQRICQHKGGFNFSLFRQGADGIGKRVQSRYPLNDSGRVDVESVRQKLVQELETGVLEKASALRYGAAAEPSISDEVSEKIPSESSTVHCDGSVPVAVSGNLTAAQVRHQLEQAASIIGSDEIPDWSNDLKCGQEPAPWNPKPHQRMPITITAADASGAQTATIGFSRVDVSPTATLHSSWLSIHSVNKELDMVARSQPSVGLSGPCRAEKHRTVTRRLGMVEWDECVLCSKKSGSRIIRRQQHLATS